MRPSTHYFAAVAVAFCIALVGSSAIADPGHGHAYGHSQVGGVSSGGMSGGSSSGALLSSGDGMLAPIYKNSSDFFTAGSAEKLRGRDINFVPPNARDSAMQKSGASDFVNSSNSGSNTSPVTSSPTTPSKSNSVAGDSATQKPDWLVNALSGGAEKSKPGPRLPPFP